MTTDVGFEPMTQDDAIEELIWLLVEDLDPQHWNRDGARKIEFEVEPVAIYIAEADPLTKHHLQNIFGSMFLNVAHTYEWRKVHEFAIELVYSIGARNQGIVEERLRFLARKLKTERWKISANKGQPIKFTRMTSTTTEAPSEEDIEKFHDELAEMEEEM